MVGSSAYYIRVISALALATILGYATPQRIRSPSIVMSGKMKREPPVLPQALVQLNAGDDSGVSFAGKRMKLKLRHDGR